MSVVQGAPDALHPPNPTITKLKEEAKPVSTEGSSDGSDDSDSDPSESESEEQQESDNDSDKNEGTDQFSISSILKVGIQEMYYIFI